MKQYNKKHKVWGRVLAFSVLGVIGCGGGGGGVGGTAGVAGNFLGNCNNFRGSALGVPVCEDFSFPSTPPQNAQIVTANYCTNYGGTWTNGTPCARNSSVGYCEIMPNAQNSNEKTVIVPAPGTVSITYMQSQCLRVGAGFASTFQQNSP